MGRVKAIPNLAEYLTVGQAAGELGVSRGTLRNWDRAGKLKPRRHPLNGYRLYRRADLEKLLARVNRTKG
jgi:excisionase family DNA binding protein